MRGTSSDRGGSKSARATGTAGSDVTVSLSAVDGEQHIIDWVQVSYDAAVSANTPVTIVTNGATTIYKSFIRAASAIQAEHFLNLAPGLECGVGASVVITLGGAGAVTGELNVGYR